MHDHLSKPNGRHSAPPLFDGSGIATLHRRWREISDRYLPFGGELSLWRYSRRPLPDDPLQGWKIHLSATVLSACEVLAVVAPYLRERGVPFKAIATLDELAKLNSGLWYGYTQVGKVVTVYPRDPVAFREIAAGLEQIMPADVAAPSVPFDNVYNPGRNIFYRYGAFAPAATDGNSLLTTPSGEEVPDRRDIPAPEWAEPPVSPADREGCLDPNAPLTNRYKIFRSIAQRGKGGVYEALDTGVEPFRLCVIKEGRRHGETAWDGRDGTDRVKNEAHVLRELGKNGVPVPEVIEVFDAGGNVYLAIDKLTDQNLHQYIAKRRRRLPPRRAIAFGKQVSRIVAQIHSAGWVWRDCKPANFVFGHDGSLRAIDLEGACPVEKHDPFPWSTPNFAAPETFKQEARERRHTNIPEDLYSLGVCLFFLFQGRLPQPHSQRTGGGSARSTKPRVEDASPRSGVPEKVRSLINRLLQRSPIVRPSAGEAFDILALAERDLL